MKLLLPLALLLATQAEARFMRVEPDQSAYEVGNKAVVFAYLEHQPSQPSKEFFLKLQVHGEPVNVVALSPKIHVALPGRFNLAGDKAVEGELFLQDKTDALRLAQAASLYRRNIAALLRELDREKDPDGRLLIEQRIAKETQRLNAVSELAERQRTLVEVSHSRLTVNPAPVKALAAFTLTADRDPATYSIGESAVFTAHPNTQFDGPGGEREMVVRGSIGLNQYTATKVGEDFLFTPPAFTAGDLGSNTLNATLYIRPLAQANLLREAYTLARRQKRAFEKSLDGATRPEEEAYFEYKVGEMERVVVALSAQLEEILTEVDSQSKEFTVE